MKICIDVRCLSQGRRTGVEEYTLNLLENLFEIDKENNYVLFFNSAKKSKFDSEIWEKFPNVSVKSFRWPNKLLNFCFWYFGRPHIDEMVGGADVLFAPNIIFLGISEKCSLVTTIHDLSFERHPEFFSWKRRFWHTFINPKKICRRADRIITVSSSSLADIGCLYGIDKKRVEVIPSAVSQRFRIIDRNDDRMIKVKEKYGLPYKFILFLGTIEPRKNIQGLVRAFNAFAQKSSSLNNSPMNKYSLVIAGEKGWLSEDIYREIEKSPVKDRIKVIHFVDDQDKEYVYNLASLFVYPSFFEGFGFPPLEAMRCGVPVICSNNSSLPEVMGDAGILIDPDKPDEIAKAMWQTLSDAKLNEHLVKNGLARSRGFSWKKCAKETLTVLTRKDKL